jgi:chromosomal replication initiation ATPase DnaA
MNEISSIQTRRPDHFARWERVRERLRVSYGEAIFKSWLQPLKLADVKNGQAMITVPTRFMREWIIAHYADNILRFWCQEDQTVHSVDIFVKAEPVAIHNPNAPVGGPKGGEGRGKALAAPLAFVGAGDAAQEPQQGGGYMQCLEPEQRAVAGKHPAHAKQPQGVFEVGQHQIFHPR